MQIFILSLNVEENASWYMDSHVIKLPSTIQQIMLLACMRGGIKYPQVKGWNGMPIVPERKNLNNPLVKWASLDESNFQLVKRLGTQLCHEYQLRFGQLHYTLGNLLMFPEFVADKEPLWKRFPLAVPMFMRSPDRGLVETYRRYYVECKHHLARWHSPRSKPEWYPQSAVDEGMKIDAAFKRAKNRGELDGIPLGTENIPTTG